LSILDTIAPRIGKKQRRWTPSVIAKSSFYVFFGVMCVFVLISWIMLGDEQTLDPIPATQTEEVVFAQVENYLKNTIVPANYSGAGQSCWSLFAEDEYTVEYLNLGSWRINGWYDKVRYYWRVDDLTLEVTRDLWFATTNERVPC